MKGYLGETIVDIHQTKYAMYGSIDWALMWIGNYGSIDGAHHKDWVLDQTSRILKGTKVIMKIAKWENGHQEERFILDEPSKEYLKWVEEIKSGEDGPETYNYEFGIAP